MRLLTGRGQRGLLVVATALVLLLAGVGAVTAAGPAPGNDIPANASRLPAFAVTVDGWNVNATTEAGEAKPCSMGSTV